MYFDDSQLPDFSQSELLVDGDDGGGGEADEAFFPCSRGHRSSLNLRTSQGGAICLVCVSNLLIASPRAPTVHVSYALSQLSQALSQPPFLKSLLTFHPHFLTSPLVHALSSFDDEPIARQIIQLVCDLCGHGALAGEFVTRISAVLSSRALAWSRHQFFTLNCLGVLLDSQTNGCATSIRDLDVLVSNLVSGLQLPSEDIQGEILFVLYKFSLHHYASKECDGTDPFMPCCPKLLYLSLDALLKTQNDDVRLNCIENPEKKIQLLVESSIGDYVFEVLRLAGFRDPVVNSCLRVLDILSTAEQAFRQTLAVGFTTLIPILQCVAEVPYHPCQSQILKLIWSCVSNFLGVATTSQCEELVLILTKMLRRHREGEFGMLSETFTIICSIFVSMIKHPSYHDLLKLIIGVQEASELAILSSLTVSGMNSNQILQSLYLLKEAYAYGHEDHSTNNSNKGKLRRSIVDVCKTHILPWLVTAINETDDEEVILGVLETFHFILYQVSDNLARELAETLISSSWFSFSFESLGLFPTERMRWRVYLMISSLVDILFGNDSGQPIREAVSHLPSDPSDFLFLLGQKSYRDVLLSSCQSATLFILYCSSLYDERIYSSNNIPGIICGKSGRVLDVQAIAQLVVSGDNYAAKVFVCLLEELVNEKSQESDLLSLLNLVEHIIGILPDTSDQLCLNGIAKAMGILYYDSGPNFSPELTDQLIFRGDMVFTRLSDQRQRQHEDFKCSSVYLKSVMAVLEGLLFYNDSRVAVNCGQCLSMIFEWEMVRSGTKKVAEKNKWCRLIVEELAMSLAVPSLVSKSCSNNHKASIYMAIALLKQEKVPGWMRSVFDDACISGILQNLSGSCLSTELILLFRELLNVGFLTAEHIGSLNRVLQECRKLMYHENVEVDCEEVCPGKAAAVRDDTSRITDHLVHLMSYSSRINRGGASGSKQLLEEIETFLRASAEEDKPGVDIKVTIKISILFKLVLVLVSLDPSPKNKNFTRLLYHQHRILCRPHRVFCHHNRHLCYSRRLPPPLPEPPAATFNVLRFESPGLRLKLRGLDDRVLCPSIEGPNSPLKRKSRNEEENLEMQQRQVFDEGGVRELQVTVAEAEP
ncbi:hypothetical protein CRG98_009370 [Punica granatum]|uniref:Protein PRD1 n=1 Tax=Punica granatum TaxID=22663 RepID=A0A2I0KP27_PUNGR|nr:hypothetical protein CRG98_009370 [Punica granatum]